MYLLVYTIIGLFICVYIGNTVFLAAFGFTSQHKYKYWCALGNVTLQLSQKCFPCKTLRITLFLFNIKVVLWTDIRVEKLTVESSDTTQFSCTGIFVFPIKMRLFLLFGNFFVVLSSYIQTRDCFTCWGTLNLSIISSKYEKQSMISYDSAKILFTIASVISNCATLLETQVQIFISWTHPNVASEKVEFFFSIACKEETRSWQTNLMLMLQLASALLPKIKCRSNFLSKDKYQLFFLSGFHILFNTKIFQIGWAK